MRVLFVTSEVAGLYKLGGLGDVSAALPEAMQNIGVQVVVALPYYRDIQLRAKALGTLSVPFDGKQEIVFLFSATLPDSDVEVVLFRHPRLDSYDGPLMEERFSFYCQSIVKFYYYTLAHTKLRFDIVHSNDWHTALVPYLLGENNKVRKGNKTLQSRDVKTVLTIHNLLYQGEAGGELAHKLSRKLSELHPTKGPHGHVINLLREGLEYTDIVTTVSPTYAKEITQKRLSQGLDDVLKRRKDRVKGILNGIDTNRWNPESDQFLSVRYTKKTVLQHKPTLKKQLQKEVGLLEREVPVFGFVGRLEFRQKGIDILLAAIERLFPETNAQVIMLGTGSREAMDEVRKVADKYRQSVSFVGEFNNPLAHMIYAGSDVILVPSRYEPCGLVQMVSMRYGSLPLVRKTGGLADTVTDKKNGFVFDDYSPSELARCIHDACAMYTGDRQRWETMLRTAMEQDFSWSRSAKLYKSLYKKLLTKKT